VRVNRVTQDSVGVNIFDGVKMELVFIGLVLGNIGEPEFVSSGCSEIALNEIQAEVRAQ